MKIILIAIALFTISFALPAKVIVLNISSTSGSSKIPGKNNSKTIEAVLGETFKIPLGSTSDEFMQINASETSSFPEDINAPKDILFNIQLLKIVDGKEMITSSPNVVTVLGVNAMITRGTKDEAEFLEIAILPTKCVE